MRKKSKGATLVELIIVMGLTLVIMSAVYSFLNTSNKSTTNEDLKSMLQSEGNVIENKILNIATQARCANNIISNGVAIDNTKIVNADLDSEGNFSLSSIELIDYNDISSVIKLEGNVLSIITEGGSQILSKNVLEMKAQPLNINQLTDDERKTKTIKDISGYKFSFKLGAKKGTVETEYNISVQANFRNYDVKLSKAKQEFNKFENAISDIWSKSESLVSIRDEKNDEILNMAISDNAIDISEIHLKQYDGSIEVIKLNGKKLTIGSREFNNVDNFMIKALDSENQNSTLKNASGFKILVTISEDKTQNVGEKVQSTYETLVKFKKS